MASCAFWANILFARQGGYFDVLAEEKPLLHLWSLSVEEQFYLLFSALLLLLLRLGWRKARIARGLLGGSLLLSLMTFVPLGRLGLDWSVYYLPHLRFGELLVGAIVALRFERGSWLRLISRSQLGLVIGRIASLSTPIILVVCVPTLLLSCLTYYGVERPARVARLSFGRAFGLFYLAPLLLLVAYWLLS